MGGYLSDMFKRQEALRKLPVERPVNQRPTSGLPAPAEAPGVMLLRPTPQPMGIFGGAKSRGYFSDQWARQAVRGSGAEIDYSGVDLVVDLMNRDPAGKAGMKRFAREASTTVVGNELNTDVVQLNYELSRFSAMKSVPIGEAEAAMGGLLRDTLNVLFDIAVLSARGVFSTEMKQAKELVTRASNVVDALKQVMSSDAEFKAVLAESWWSRGWRVIGEVIKGGVRKGTEWTAEVIQEAVEAGINAALKHPLGAAAIGVGGLGLLALGAFVLFGMSKR